MFALNSLYRSERLMSYQKFFGIDIQSTRHLKLSSVQQMHDYVMNMALPSVLLLADIYLWVAAGP